MLLRRGLGHRRRPSPALHPHPRTSTFTLHNLARTAAPPTLLLTSDVAVAASITSPSETPEWVKTLQQFQDSHAFILGILSAIVVRVAINEVRARIEKPVLDKVTEKTREQLTPNTQQVPPGAWVGSTRGLHRIRSGGRCIGVDTVPW